MPGGPGPGIGNLFPTLGPQGVHAAGCYYVNIVSNTIQRQCNPLIAAGMGALGYFGTGGMPATAFNAFPTFEAAQKFANDVASGKQKIASFPFTPSQTGLGPAGSGQNDWTNLVTRLAEFAIGGILITVGLVAILGKTKTAQTAVNIVGMTPPGRAIRAEQSARRIVRERGETKRIKSRVRSLES